jgi:hypothetical protein
MLQCRKFNNSERIQNQCIQGFNKISDNTKKELMKKLLPTVALFFDERSMIGYFLVEQNPT